MTSGCVGHAPCAHLRTPVLQRAALEARQQDVRDRQLALAQSEEYVEKLKVCSGVVRGVLEVRVLAPWFVWEARSNHSPHMPPYTHTLPHAATPAPVPAAAPAAPAARCAGHAAGGAAGRGALGP